MQKGQQEFRNCGRKGEEESVSEAGMAHLRWIRLARLRAVRALSQGRPSSFPSFFGARWPLMPRSRIPSPLSRKTRSLDRGERRPRRIALPRSLGRLRRSICSWPKVGRSQVEAELSLSESAAHATRALLVSTRKETSHHCAPLVI